MTSSHIKVLLALALCGLGLVAVSCGDDESGATVRRHHEHHRCRRGGVDSLDPGYWYYQQDYAQLANTTQRQLYGWKPDENKPTPDLAEALPEVSNGGKTVTVKIKPNIKYSAPLAEPDGQVSRHQVRRSSAASCRRSATATQTSTTATSRA